MAEYIHVGSDGKDIGLPLAHLEAHEARSDLGGTTHKLRTSGTDRHAQDAKNDQKRG